jgi:purine-binding chemotaxis protein CheW
MIEEDISDGGFNSFATAFNVAANLTATAERDKKDILRARARELAREPEETAAAEDHTEVVEFLLAYENYAIESVYIREVHLLKDLTPVPCTPPFVLGMINVRGQIVTVIDIKRFFDLPDKGLSDLNKVIIVHSDAGQEVVDSSAAGRSERAAAVEFGILADAILGVRSIPLKELHPSLPTLTGVRTEYLKGVTNERLIVLDVRKILFDPKITVHEEVE